MRFILDSTNKWCHAACLTFFTKHIIFSGSIYIAEVAKFCSFCGWVVYIYISFMPSSVDGHFGCFLVLAMLNSAATEHWVQVSFEVFNFSRYLSKSEIMVVLGSIPFFPSCHLSAHLAWSPFPDQGSDSIAAVKALSRNHWTAREFPFYPFGRWLLTYRGNGLSVWS